MLPLETLLVFFLTAALLGLTPGPDNLFVLTQSALYGRRAGWYITLGLCTGLLVHTAAVALGVAAIFQTSALAFELLKLAGAGYLLWLAWQALRARPAGGNDQATGHSATGQETLMRVQDTAAIEKPAAIQTANTSSTVRLYRRGIIMNLTNPKVSIFFLAFLPQFTQTGNGPISLQIVVLGLIFILSTILVFGSIALGAGSLGNILRRSPRVELWLNRVAGMVFIGLAVKLATSRQ